MSYLIRQLGESGMAALPTGPVIPREAIWLSRDAAAIVDAARTEAAQLARAAQAAYDDCRRRGHDAGLEAARAEWGAQMATRVAETERYLDSFDERLIDLVIQAVHRLVGELPEPQRVAALLRSLLDTARDQARVRLYVHPQRLAAVQACVAGLRGDYPHIQALEVVADGALEHRQCRLESEIGSVETSLDAQLEALRHALRQAARMQLARTDADCAGPDDTMRTFGPQS